MITGDLRAGDERRSRDSYDRDTADAVRLFQTRHGLLVDRLSDLKRWQRCMCHPAAARSKSL